MDGAGQSGLTLMPTTRAAAGTPLEEVADQISPTVASARATHATTVVTAAAPRPAKPPNQPTATPTPALPGHRIASTIAIVSEATNRAASPAPMDHRIWPLRRPISRPMTTATACKAIVAAAATIAVTPAFAADRRVTSPSSATLAEHWPGVSG